MKMAIIKFCLYILNTLTLLPISYQLFINFMKVKLLSYLFLFEMGDSFYLYKKILREILITIFIQLIKIP